MKKGENISLNLAIRRMRDWAENKAPKSIFAASCLVYLELIPQAIDNNGSEGLGAQLLYALVNARGWRGPEAKEAKKVIRDWIKKNDR